MRRLSLLLTLALFLVASAALAQAPIPRIYRSAEQAFLPPASSNCSLIDTSLTYPHGTGIQCTDSATLTQFAFWTTFPYGAQNVSWGVIINYEAPAATSVCAWDVALGSLIEGTVADSPNSATVVVSNTNQAHSADTVYKTNQATIGVKRLDTGAACNPVFGVCSQRPVRVDVKINSGTTTAASCTLKSIELIP